MCKICNIERGECEFLGGDDIVVMRKVNSKKNLHRFLGFYLDRDEDTGEFRILATLVDDTAEAIGVPMQIQFCPFCGRKLHE